MANTEQLALLKRSVEEWNQWRWENPEQLINLEGADLRGANLEGAHLRGANLLIAKLEGADLRYADLRKANLGGANLAETNLLIANLEGAYLRNAYLRRALLRIVDLEGADLRKANLEGADLRKADLRRANLEGANLTETNLTETNLGKVNLVRTQALATNFSAATFTGACLKDWNTNRRTNLEGAKADYIHLDHEKGEFIDRRPYAGNFKPGEFATLFQQALYTLDLIFVDGIDWQTFFASFQELRQQYNDAELNIQAIEKKSGGSFVVKLEVDAQTDKAALKQSWDGIYEENQQLKAQLWKTEGKLDESREQLENFQQKVLQGMSDRNQTIINNNAPIANFANQMSGNAKQIYNAAQEQSLAEAAKGIQALLDQLSKIYPTENVMQRAQLATVAAEQAQANLNLWQRIVSAIDAGTIGAVGEMLSHPVATFFIDAAKDLAETQPQN